MNWTSLQKPLLGVVIAACMGITACSGGGSSASAGGAATANCAPVAGVSDPLQAALAQLADAAGAIPEAGAAAGDMATAIASLTDAVDALAAVVQQAAATQDPAAIAAAGDQVGDLLGCSLDNVTASLEGLGATGTPVDALVAQALAQIDTLQSLLATDPLSAGTPAELGDVTGQLSALAVQLALVSSTLPLDQTGVPELQLVTAAMAGGLLNFAILMNEFGQLDEAGTANALITYYTQLANLLSTDAVDDLPVPVNLPVATLIAQVNVLAAGVVPQLQGGLILILGVVFDALETVLAGGVPAPTDFQNILLGLIAETPLSGPFATLVSSLAGGGDVAALTDLLGGVPVLGELVAVLLGDTTSDPTVLLMSLLAGGVPTDVVGVPATLAGVLGDLPGLGPVSLPAMQDLLESLLGQVGGGGLPGTGELSEIENLLVTLGNQFTALNLSQVTDLFDTILSLLFD